MDGSNIGQVATDPKDWEAKSVLRVYVPRGEEEQYTYYQEIARDQSHLGLEIHLLPHHEEITAKYIRDLNDGPGILALAMTKVPDGADGSTKLEGVPFVVPGGRFNELYGWDSYFINRGLNRSGQLDLARGMLKNFVFCIKNYGKILNANRTYYLGRSQPPLLTSMVLEVYNEIKHEPGAKDLLREGLAAAIQEYYTIWTSKQRLDPRTGLSRYAPIGVGVPPETEKSHFDHILKPHAEASGMEIPGYVEKYNACEIDNQDLDEYFRHDRAARESGHDTSYRLDGRTADLATVDLNSLLYKYETDIANAIRTVFDNELGLPEEFQTKENRETGFETPEIWEERAKTRRDAMNQYLWDEEKGMYYDYDCAQQAHTGFESATTFVSMWARIPSEHQAAKLVENLSKFEEYGGLASTTLESRGETGPERPNRQWDYPYGWAPHQDLTWTGLLHYGYVKEAQRLAYKWLCMITQVFADFNGTVVEKYDVTRQVDAHKVSAEYGNQGLGFKGVPPEGFGWVNAGYVVGCELLTPELRKEVGRLVPYELLDEELINNSARQHQDLSSI